MHLQTVPRPGNEKVHLAVGDDKQCLIVLKWASRFMPPQTSFVLVHIQRPAIPKVLGASMPASTLIEHRVSAHRIDARNTILKKLRQCLQTYEVEAEILIIEKDNVVDALLEAITKHNITTLVMGAKKRKHDWKGKTADALEKQADCLCNILYLHNGDLVASRHPHTARNIGIPSLIGCHFSGNSNTTRSSSFFNSCSTTDTFDAGHLDDPSLVMNTTYIYNDSRFNTIIGLKSFVPFRELVNQQILADHSRELYQAFHIRYCDIFTGCQFIGGFDSLIGVDSQSLGEAHWKYIKSWPAVLEYVVSVLKTLQMQLLKKDHRACNVFTYDDLSEAAKKPIRRLFSVASIVSDHEVTKSPEKLFCVLNMYTALMGAYPILRKVFNREFMSTHAEMVLAKLKDSVRGIIEELKGLIRTYDSEKVVQDGAILSLSRYLMRYISLLVKHKVSLNTILDHDHTDDLLTSDGTSLTCRLVFELITDLESVIYKHSRSLTSEGLQCIFLMNNIHFILQEVEQSDVQLTVKAEWFKKRQSRIKGYIKRYIYASWVPVTSILEVSRGMPPSKKARVNFLSFRLTSPTPLQNFASAFSATCNLQMLWKVPNPALRDELRVKILEFITRAYHGHLESQKQYVGQNAKNFEREWKNKISELFEG